MALITTFITTFYVLHLLRVYYNVHHYVYYAVYNYVCYAVYFKACQTFWHRQTDTLHGNWEAEVDLFRYSIEAFECATSCSSRRTARKGVSRK